MIVRFWGVRGSLATPEESKVGFGGNTACVELELDESHIVLDAGTGIRALGERLAQADSKPVHVLLSHLHLDHIQGLLFFAPLFQPGREVVIWGPAHGSGHMGDLRTNLARYLSAPLSPVEIRELPAAVRFESCPPGWWDVPGARVRATPVLHRGLTLGLRIEAPEARLAYLPDHEPALSGRLDTPDRDWLSGADVAGGADLLIHDGQFSDAQYEQTRGWGHSTVADAVAYARRFAPKRLRLFHHDPGHTDDDLEALEAMARDLASTGGALDDVSMAREGETILLGG